MILYYIFVPCQGARVKKTGVAAPARIHFKRKRGKRGKMAKKDKITRGAAKRCRLDPVKLMDIIEFVEQKKAEKKEGAYAAAAKAHGVPEGSISRWMSGKEAIAKRAFFYVIYIYIYMFVI